MYFITPECKWPTNASERARARMGPHVTSAQKPPSIDLPSVLLRTLWKSSHA